MALKPGSASRPYFGVKPAIIDATGNVIEGPGDGNLVITDPWPGMLRTIYGDHARFLQTYFSMYPGLYFTGDGARRDEDGDYWITGRVDDVINVSGHRLGTAEVESALVAHPGVAEAAVVGFPHEIKGQGIYAYVTLKADRQPSEALRDGASALGPEGNRGHCRSGYSPVGPRPAQNPVGQDHAADSAQNRRQFARRSGRYEHPRGACRG